MNSTKKKYEGNWFQNYYHGKNNYSYYKNGTPKRLMGYDMGTRIVRLVCILIDILYRKIYSNYLEINNTNALHEKKSFLNIFLVKLYYY